MELCFAASKSEIQTEFYWIQDSVLKCSISFQFLPYFFNDLNHVSFDLVTVLFNT